MGLYKGHQIFEEHNFSVWRRYRCISNYPEPKYGNHYTVGNIVEFKHQDLVIGEREFINSPTIFQPIPWYESRTFEEMFSVLMIQMNASQYYVPGDVLEVEGFEVNTNTTKPYFIGYKVGSQILIPADVIPLRIFKDYDRRISKRITQAKSVY